MSPLDVKCMVCGAAKGVGCHTIVHGKPMDEPHIGRSETHHYCLRCGRVHEDGKCQR